MVTYNLSAVLFDRKVGGHRDCVKTLIEARVDLNARDNDGTTALKMISELGAKPMRVAGAKEFTEIINLLKANGAKE